MTPRWREATKIELLAHGRIISAFKKDKESTIGIGVLYSDRLTPDRLWVRREESMVHVREEMEGEFIEYTFVREPLLITWKLSAEIPEEAV